MQMRVSGSAGYLAGFDQSLRSGEARIVKYTSKSTLFLNGAKLMTGFPSANVMPIGWRPSASATRLIGTMP